MTADVVIKIKSFTEDQPSHEENPPRAQYFTVNVALSHEEVLRMRRAVFARMAERTARSIANEMQGVMMEFFEQMQEPALHEEQEL